MQRLASVLLLIFSIMAGAQTPGDQPTSEQPSSVQSVEWDLRDYQLLQGDFNGDDKPDSIIFAKSPDFPSILTLGLTLDDSTSEQWISHNPYTDFLVVGDFDNDSQDEILVLDKDLSGLYWELNEQNILVEGPQKIKISGYNKNRQINFTHLVRGDFNGDTSDDLLAYAQDSHDVVVFHNKNQNKKINFKFDSQLFLDNDAPLKPFVSDFNGDGMEDIALLSTQADGHSFLAFAGEKGKFKKSEFENITPYFEGADFSTEHFSLHLWSDGESEERLILRLANSEHGVDEEGAPLNQAGEPVDSNNYNKNDSSSENTYSAYDVEEVECPHHAYSPMNRRVESTCGFDSQVENSGAGSVIAGLLPSGSLNADSSQTSIFKSADGNTSSATAPASPAPAEAEVTEINKITISWEGVTGATYFNREVSLNGGAYQNTKTYPATQTSVIFYNQQVRSYRYRVRACNSSGCSPWTYTGTVTVHAVIVPPATPYAVPSIVGGNYQPVNATFAATVTPVSGADYYNIHVGYSPSNTPYITGSSSTYHSGLQTGGSYGYRYVRYSACNYTSGCSGLSPYQRIYVYTAPGQPNGLGTNTSSVTTATSATLSWSKAGGTIPSGYYKLEELKPGQSWAHIASITAGYAASFSRTVAPYNVPGTYSYRLRACSPDRGCGGTTSIGITLHNRNPIAGNDSASVNEGQSVSINVLSNDSDPDGHYVGITGSSAATNGSVSCSTSACTFTASNTLSSNATGTFTYSLSDGYGGTASGSVSVAINNVSEGTVATPTISPNGGTFQGSQSVTLTTSTSGATIYYTTNGATPTTSSATYNGAFTLTSSATVKAIATKHDYSNSAVVSSSFTKIEAPLRRVVFIHTDLLGSPAAETDENGNVL